MDHSDFECDVLLGGGDCRDGACLVASADSRVGRAGIGGGACGNWELERALSAGGAGGAIGLSESAAGVGGVSHCAGVRFACVNGHAAVANRVHREDGECAWCRHHLHHGGPCGR